MAASLIKLFITAALANAPVASNGTVTTTVNPEVTRYNALLTVTMISPTETTILAEEFLDDDGNPVPVNSLPAVPTDGYFNVYVNGVLQQEGLSTLTTASLVLDTIGASVGTPVVLEVADFSNTSSVITTPQTISAPAIDVTT
ncbi:hypothetical protein PAECIP111891_03325 [Paenibacillus allorhizoplanae]|uniref:DUF4183 domain-containing protein n=1 Tax=Paenibacillus allorhizoplanae TaxID=2905648 RepID=A0ABM9CBJ2_9BACL|nr:DUF4183 domain-containing protein [Paenibacillus allorhizoplanae]CAH1209489.1 hypothetical protein PAECIP111891_03325 [Paenibacillus allorhizoplanae]